nr:immunoglobulin light chain junction region [Macaca mulatta]MOW00611.1 immunoglobulin light chain junction region [Macaca mulatta]
EYYCWLHQSGAQF